MIGALTSRRSLVYQQLSLPFAGSHEPIWCNEMDNTVPPGSQTRTSTLQNQFFALRRVGLEDVQRLQQCSRHSPFAPSAAATLPSSPPLAPAIEATTNPVNGLHLYLSFVANACTGKALLMVQDCGSIAALIPKDLASIHDIVIAQQLRSPEANEHASNILVSLNLLVACYICFARCASYFVTKADSEDYLIRTKASTNSSDTQLSEREQIPGSLFWCRAERWATSQLAIVLQSSRTAGSSFRSSTNVEQRLVAQQMVQFVLPDLGSDQFVQSTALAMAVLLPRCPSSIRDASNVHQHRSVLRRCHALLDYTTYESLIECLATHQQCGACGSARVWALAPIPSSPKARLLSSSSFQRKEVSPFMANNAPLSLQLHFREFLRHAVVSSVLKLWNQPSVAPSRVVSLHPILTLLFQNEPEDCSSPSLHQAVRSRARTGLLSELLLLLTTKQRSCTRHNIGLYLRLWQYLSEVKGGKNIIPDFCISKGAMVWSDEPICRIVEHLDKPTDEKRTRSHGTSTEFSSPQVDGAIGRQHPRILQWIAVQSNRCLVSQCVDLIVKQSLLCGFSRAWDVSAINALRCFAWLHAPNAPTVQVEFISTLTTFLHQLHVALPPRRGESTGGPQTTDHWKLQQVAQLATKPEVLFQRIKVDFKVAGIDTACKIWQDLFQLIFTCSFQQRNGIGKLFVPELFEKIVQVFKSLYIRSCLN